MNAFLIVAGIILAIYAILGLFAVLSPALNDRGQE